MVTVILLALSTSVDSVISVIPISDDIFAGYLTITNDATFISVILASATTCYRKESEVEGEEGGREEAGEEGRGGGGQERKGRGGGRRGRGGEEAYGAILQPHMIQLKHKVSSRQGLVNYYCA